MPCRATSRTRTLTTSSRPPSANLERLPRTTASTTRETHWQRRSKRPRSRTRTRRPSWRRRRPSRPRAALADGRLPRGEGFVVGDGTDRGVAGGPRPVAVATRGLRRRRAAPVDPRPAARPVAGRVAGRRVLEEPPAAASRTGGHTPNAGRLAVERAADGRAGGGATLSGEALLRAREKKDGADVSKVDVSSYLRVEAVAATDTNGVAFEFELVGVPGTLVGRRFRAATWNGRDAWLKRLRAAAALSPRSSKASPPAPASPKRPSADEPDDATAAALRPGRRLDAIARRRRELAAASPSPRASSIPSLGRQAWQRSVALAADVRRGHARRRASASFASSRSPRSPAAAGRRRLRQCRRHPVRTLSTVSPASPPRPRRRRPRGGRPPRLHRPHDGRCRVAGRALAVAREPAAASNKSAVL